MSFITILATEEANVSASFEATVNGRDYYTILKDGKFTQDFVEVAEGSTPAQVLEAYFAA